MPSSVSRVVYAVEIMVKPNGQLVAVSSIRYRTYTSALSNWSSSSALLSLSAWEISSWGRFHAYMHSAFILTELRYPAMRLAPQLDHRRFVHPGPLVLRAGPLKSPTPTTDRDRTVSRRSEPSSRTALIGEQPNPWELLHPQDAMSRHRGAKPERRCELLTPISLLSPAYLLSVERWPFHAEPPDH